MSRILYQVAVLSERTRNRDIQWIIEPICTNVNCTIHPAFLHNLNNCGDLTNTNSWSNRVSSECLSQRKDHLLVDRSKYASEAKSFETAQTVSGYSSAGSQLTNSSEFTSESSSGCLKNEIVIKETFEESIEWSNEDASDEVAPFGQVIEATFVPSPAVFRSSYQQPDMSKMDALEEREDENIDNETENEESIELITKSRSFRDVLLGYGVSNGMFADEEKSSRSNSDISELELEVNPSNMTNPPMSLSIPEPEEACAGLQSHVIKMVKLTETDKDVEEKEVERNYHVTQNRPSVEISCDTVESGQRFEDGQTAQNEFSSSNETNPQNGHDAENGHDEQNGYRTTHVSSTNNELSVNNGHHTQNGHDGESQSAPADLRNYNISINSDDDVDEGQSEMALRTGLKNNYFKLTSPKEDEMNDSRLCVGRGRTKNRKKKKIVAASFSPPTYQVDIFAKGSIKHTFTSKSSKEKAEGSLIQTKSPQKCWKLNDNVKEFDTDTNEFPSLQQNHCRKRIKDKPLQSIGQDALNNRSNNIGPCVVSSDSGLGSVDLGETLQISHKINCSDVGDVQTKATPSEIQEVTSGVSNCDNECPQHGDSGQNVNKRLVLQGFPYICKIKHGNDLKLLRQFLWEWTSIMPEALHTQENLETLLSISQRIVRIAVRKPYLPVDTKLLEEYQNMQGTELKKEDFVTEHFGTGFCFYIDQYKMYIRTHSKVISSPCDARRAVVQFNIRDLRCNGEVTVECNGVDYEFENNTYSLSSIFACPTPPELITHLHLFGPIPILQRNSVFERDSCYFTDSSADSSFSVFEESNSEQLEKISQTRHAWNKVNDECSPNTSNAPSPNKSSPPLHQHSPKPASTESPSQTEKEVTDEISTNVIEIPTETGKLTWDGFLQDYTTSPIEIKPPPEDECLPRRDNINVPMYNPYTWKRDSKGALPVGGLPVFTPFRSYSADVIDLSVDKARHFYNVSPFVDHSSIWDYASLIYAQHDHREDYDKMFQPKVLKHYDNYGRPCDAETKRELFAPSSRNQEISSDYDYHELLIEKSSGDVLQSDADLERVVDEIVSEDTERFTVKTRESMRPSEICSNTVVVISYPHGGSKMVSSGSFTSRHFGGELYRVPTCMGSCGAPLLSFTEDRKIYVTDILHSGTASKDDDHFTSFGLSCYYGNAHSFAQTVAYTK